jgi:hypothetical protein
MVANAQVPQGSCTKTVTFAVAENGSLDYRLPKVSLKWLDKTQKKYPKICFSQYGAPTSTNTEQYLIVLSTQSSAFNGLYPAYRTTTGTTTNPVSGNGTISDNSGSLWSYTYQGTITTTTTTTQQTDLPYTDTTIGLFANAYNQRGNPIGSAQRSESFRQGGDAANTLGYNLGARLSAIHIKERLLEDIVNKVSAAPKLEVFSRPAIESQPSVAPTAAQPPEGDYEELWTHAEIGMHNIETFAASRNVALPPIDDVASRGIVKCIIDAKSPECSDNWPLGQKAFAWMLELGTAIREAKGSKDSLLVTVSDDLTPLWSNIRDVYCTQSPSATYSTLDNELSSCPTKGTQ